MMTIKEAESLIYQLKSLDDDTEISENENNEISTEKIRSDINDIFNSLEYDFFKNCNDQKSEPSGEKSKISEKEMREIFAGCEKILKAGE